MAVLMKDNYVVFVDDEMDLHVLFRQLLRKPARQKNFLIECFANGLDCYNFVEQNIDKINIILIVSDIKMPVMDGFSLLEKLKNKFPDLRVIMASAYGDDETIAKATSLGAKRFLKKPIDFDVVLEEIDDSMATMGIA